VSSSAEAGAEHPRHRLDEVIHSPVRFSVVAALARAEEAEFGWIRETVGVSDSVLSKQIATLEQAGYVDVRKGYVGKRPRTWLRLSRRGREVFAQHVAALREIADGDTVVRLSPPRATG
jgi:DNA-binding MarR family transcriptional regulator